MVSAMTLRFRECFPIDALITPGAVMLLHFPVHNGIPVIVQSRFDPVSFCANIELYKVTAALVVPPVLVVLSRHEGARFYHVFFA